LRPSEIEKRKSFSEKRRSIFETLKEISDNNKNDRLRN